MLNDLHKLIYVYNDYIFIYVFSKNNHDVNYLLLLLVKSINNDDQNSINVVVIQHNKHHHFLLILHKYLQSNEYNYFPSVQIILTSA